MTGNGRERERAQFSPDQEQSNTLQLAELEKPVTFIFLYNYLSKQQTKLQTTTGKPVVLGLRKITPTYVSMVTGKKDIGKVEKLPLQRRCRILFR